MVDAIVASMVGAVVAMIAYVIVKQIVAGIPLGSLTAAELVIIDMLPIVMGIMVLVGVFTALVMKGEGIGIDFVSILQLPLKLVALIPVLAGFMLKLSLPRKKFKPNLINYQLIAEESGISREQFEKALGAEIVTVKNLGKWKLDGNKLYLDNSYQWFVTNKKKNKIIPSKNLTIFHIVGVHRKTDNTVEFNLSTKEVPKL